MESSSKQNKIKPPAARSRAPDAAVPCRRHPRHRQSPGVCSVCLNEKLSQLSSQNRPKAGRKTRSSSWSSSYLSSLSSSAASSCASPVFKNTSVNPAQQALDKSRSVASVFHRRKDRHGCDRTTKRGFWSKLMLFPRRKLGNDKNKGSMMHSRSTRERVIVTAVQY